MRKTTMMRKRRLPPDALALKGLNTGAILLDALMSSTSTHLPDFTARLIALSAWLNPSAEPIAMLAIGFPNSAARSSTRPDASKPGTEHSSAGTFARSSVSTLAARSSSFSAAGMKSSPSTDDTNSWAAAITRSGRKA